MLGIHHTRKVRANRPARFSIVPLIFLPLWCPMDIATATKSYESWLTKVIPLYRPDLEYKHERMANPSKSFPFFRGTYYRWAQLWADTTGHLVDAPTVIAVGDLHVENFGTWRDADGRLCWGVNDFDEVDRLPFTNDLVRLAASLRFAKWSPGLNIKFGRVLQGDTGYRNALEAGGTPFVLEENNAGLRALAMSKERDPVLFWKKLTQVLDDPAVDPPKAARSALVREVADHGLSPQFRIRPHVGMGSLGKNRYVALVQSNGGWLAREAKSATPPATAWVAGKKGGDAYLAARAIRNALRSPDPFYHVVDGWVIRRLGPRCSRIELENLKYAKDTDLLLHAMGAEAANVHLGTPGVAQEIQRALTGLPKGWLEEAARNMARLILQDWADWQRTMNKRQRK